MDYTSTLETMKVSGLLYPGVSYTELDLGQSSTPWLWLVVLEIPHGSQQGALFTLSELFNITYRLIMRVL